MPYYCYETTGGDVIERYYPLGQAPRRIRVKGKIAVRSITAEHATFKDTPGAWPKESWAMGVHPSQAAQAAALDISLGVPTRYNAKGRPVYTDREHRARHLRAHGMRDNDAGYSDPAGR